MSSDTSNSKNNENDINIFNKTAMKQPELKMDVQNDDDNDNDNDNDKIFKKWLSENGAKYDKILWPSNKTISGSRGAIAKKKIYTDEPMVTIPSHLMISPMTAKNSEIKDVFLNGAITFVGDEVLTIYLMYEVVKGKDSFYWPFFQILPEVETIADYSNEALVEFQDERLLIRAQNRYKHLKRAFERLSHRLYEKYPAIFNPEKHTWKAFLFSFKTLQARAFGKRLPWTALVPFADCLNHSNVQTKYDFNVEENGLFRLYPSGGNVYDIGNEVFNSYGRRSNSNLLLEYGFAILDNEWDFADIAVNQILPENENEDFHVVANRKKLILRTKIPFGRFAITSQSLEIDLIVYFRILLLTNDDIILCITGKKDIFIVSDINQEIHAFRFMITTIEKMLTEFPTSLEDDERRLSSWSSSRQNNNSTSLQNALVYRITRKRIIKKYIDLSYKMLDILENLSKNNGGELKNTEEFNNFVSSNQVVGLQDYMKSIQHLFLINNNTNTTTNTILDYKPSSFTLLEEDNNAAEKEEKFCLSDESVSSFLSSSFSSLEDSKDGKEEETLDD